MSVTPKLEDVIAFLVADEARVDADASKLAPLVFLADNEHERLYGEPLMSIDWSWDRGGPFSPAVEDAVAVVAVKRGMRTATDRGRRSATPTAAATAPNGDLGPRARRALSRTVGRFGNLPQTELEQAARAAGARLGQPMDHSRTTRRLMAVASPDLVAFLARAPKPVIEERGDPAASTAEDLDILADLDALRREANGELA